MYCVLANHFQNFYPIITFRFKSKITHLQTLSCVVTLQFKTMEVDADIGTEQLQESGYESFFGPLDIILLLALLGAATWWFLRSKKKEDVSMGRSYSIQ